MKQKLDRILILINEAIQADDSGTCHLIIARDAVENAVKAIERSVAFIMEQQHCQTGSSHDFEGLYNTEEC